MPQNSTTISLPAVEGALAKLGKGLNGKCSGRALVYEATELDTHPLKLQIISLLSESRSF